jgi:hypothetical protein
MRFELLRCPAYAGETCARTGRIQIGYGYNVHSGNVSSLRQEHRTELSGAYERYAQRVAIGCTLQQETVEIHGSLR